MRLTEMRVLTFDCYGTLIDWEGGIHAALAPLLARAGRHLDKEAATSAFARHESGIQAASPGLAYPEVLARVHARLAQDWGVPAQRAEDERFGASVGEWPAFVDSAGALQYLRKFYALVVLSNVDRASFRASARRLGVEFDAVFTAEEIGSYKPDPRNFEYMLARLQERGFAPGEVLHVAQSLFHDHVPASALGLATAWIDRGHEAGAPGATPPAAAVTPDLRFPDLQSLVAAHQDALRGEAG